MARPNMAMLAALLRHRRAAVSGGGGPEDPPPIDPPPPPGARSILGMGIPELTYYKTALPFLDLGKQRIDWGYGGGGSIPLDANGWPRQVVAGSGAYAGFQARLPQRNKTYVALYQGTGTLGIDFGGSIVSSTNGRYVMNLAGADGDRVAIMITSSLQSDPVRNLYVVPIEHESDHQTVLFNEKWMDIIAPFQTLRFMDFFLINRGVTSGLTDWASRCRPEHALQATDKGAAIEFAIDMCNKNGSDIHFNIPLSVNTNWIDGAMALLAQRLHPLLHVYLEWGNEIWNDAFNNGDYAHQLGVAAGLPNEEHDTRYYYQAMMGRYAKERLESFMSPTRVHHVLASQLWDDKIRALCDRQFLHGLYTDGSRAYEHAEYLHLAPYLANARETFGTTTSQLLNLMRTEDLPEVLSQMTFFKGMANDRSLKLGVYEAGQHLYHWDFDNTFIQNLLTAVNRDPGMYQLMYDYLDTLVAAGVDGPLCLFTLVEEPDAFGRWGWLENMYQTVNANPRQCPKYDAAVRWNADNPLP